jgi:hypothetical protein
MRRAELIAKIEQNQAQIRGLRSAFVGASPASFEVLSSSAHQLMAEIWDLRKLAEALPKDNDAQSNKKRDDLLATLSTIQRNIRGLRAKKERDPWNPNPSQSALDGIIDSQIDDATFWESQLEELLTLF